MILKWLHKYVSQLYAIYLAKRTPFLICRTNIYNPKKSNYNGNKKCINQQKK